MKKTVLIAVVAMAVAAPARADWLLTPYFGVVFGGAANQYSTRDLDDTFEQ